MEVCFSVNDYELIKGFKLVSVKEYNVKCREFAVKYYKQVNANLFEGNKNVFNINGDINSNYKFVEEEEINNCAFSDFSDSLISLSNFDAVSRYNSN